MGPRRPVRAQTLSASAYPHRAGGCGRAGPLQDPSLGRAAAADGHRRFPPPSKMAVTPALLVTCPQGGFPLSRQWGGEVPCVA